MARIVDEVFVSLTLEATPPQVIPEGLGSVEISLRLSDTPSQPITLAAFTPNVRSAAGWS